jgi:hypothetical protein
MKLIQTDITILSPSPVRIWGKRFWDMSVEIATKCDFWPSGDDIARAVPPIRDFILINATEHGGYDIRDPIPTDTSVVEAMFDEIN